ncbi:signal recognition particle-docking protein FtsY [Oligella urethralis]|uniref:signal recognition particle-docking protein FtsY n=1 Tax=Oligella urethralis TaxID=90245 RepID=UPI00243080F9|nr:signal recognition particle-docking protein FtsY [Oligella urethralis]
MFRFFKRKKAKEENQASQEAEVAQAHEQEEPAASEAIVPEEPVTTSTDTVTAETVEESAVAIEPVETVAPTVESSVTPVPLEPQPEVLVTEVEAEAEASSPAPVADAEVAPSPVVTEAAPAKSSWMQRLRQGLSRTGSSIGSLFVGVKVDEALFEELEMALLMADAGIEATESLLAKLRTKVKQQRIEDAAEVKEALKALLSEHLKPLEKDFMLPLDGTSVVMIAGVNGAGKTTSIGKLAHHFQAAGASVLLAAGDTFRAAAREQLVEWGKRNQVAVIAQDGGDPAAVAFDAVNAGKARKANVVMVDTAGRLPTQLHLMEELKKIKRVINKADSEAPHEVLLVVDGNTGQNVITQIKAFDAALGLTGLVVTKLDGTAKGGTLAAVAAGSQGVRPIPVYWIGVGESLHDLQPFSAAEFANALLG